MKLLTTILLLISLHAHADGLKSVSLEAGYGACNAQPPHEGTWVQGDLPHTMHLTDGCGELGLSFGTPMRDVYIKTRYVSLGQYSINSISNADDNDDASRRGLVSADPRRAECAGGYYADCHYQFNGSGGAKGFVFAIAAEPFQIGPVKLGGEMGLLLYKARWRETIRPIDCPGNQCWEMQIDQRTGWQRAPEFGLTARWDYLYVALRRYELRMPGGTANPAASSQAPGITAGFRAPIHAVVVGLNIPF